MRFEVIERQRFQHAAVLAHTGGGATPVGIALAVLLLCAPDMLAKSWSEIRPGVETRPLAVTIGHPTTIRWKVAEHPAFVSVVVDRDLHPRVAAAYETFAAIVGVSGDPLYVVMTPYLEPVAAGADASFLEDVAVRWAAGRNKLVAEAGLAVRRHLIANPAAAVAPVRTPALQRYDWIGGSVFRRDGEFDKALIDQAMFVLERPGSDEARATLDYVLSEFQDQGGAFAAGLRADSLVPRDGAPVVVEAGHYQWTLAELRHLLGIRVADIVAYHYRMTEEGNFLPGGYNVLRAPRDLVETATRFTMPAAEVDQRLGEARVRLYDVRSKRPDPQRHALLITEYNGRMISALARAAVTLSEPRYAEAAQRALRGVLQKNFKADRLLRGDGVPALPEDWAALIRGMLDLYEAAFDVTLLSRAIEMQRLADVAPALVLPDAIGPLAAPVPADLEIEALVRLAAITGDAGWSRRAGAALAEHRQLIIAGIPGGDDTNALLQAARASAHPSRMIFLVGSGRIRSRLAVWMPYVKDVVEIEKQPVATVCQSRTCVTAAVQPRL